MVHVYQLDISKELHEGGPILEEFYSKYFRVHFTITLHDHQREEIPLGEVTTMILRKIEEEDKKCVYSIHT